MRIPIGSGRQPDSTGFPLPELDSVTGGPCGFLGHRCEEVHGQDGFERSQVRRRPDRRRNRTPQDEQRSVRCVRPRQPLHGRGRRTAAEGRAKGSNILASLPVSLRASQSPQPDRSEKRATKGGGTPFLPHRWRKNQSLPWSGCIPDHFPSFHPPRNPLLRVERLDALHVAPAHTRPARSRSIPDLRP